MWKNIGTDTFLYIVWIGLTNWIFCLALLLKSIKSGFRSATSFLVCHLHQIYTDDWKCMLTSGGLWGNAFPNDSGNYFCSGFNINILIWEHLHKPVSRQFNFSYHNSWPNHIIGLSCCFDINKTLLTLWLCLGQIDPKFLIFPENTS